MEQAETRNSTVATRIGVHFPWVLKTLCFSLIIGVALSPYRRIQLEWSGFSELTVEFAKTFHTYHLYAAIYLLPIIAIPKVTDWWNRIVSFKVAVIVGLVSLACIVPLTLLRVPGFWWTWETLGLYIATVMLVVVFLRGRVPSGEATITGLALVFIAIGIWEIPYQIGLKYIYDLPQIGMAETSRWVTSEIAIELPFIVGGAMLLYIQNIRYHFLHFSQWTLLLFIIGGGFYLAWFATGFWVDVSYDWTTQAWVQSPDNPAAMLIYRMSKSFTALGFASLVIPRRAG